MTKIFLSLAFFPAVIFGAFSQEEKFWEYLSKKDYESADLIYTHIAEHECYDLKDYIRSQIMCVALRTAQGYIYLAKWETDSLCEQLDRRIGR